MSKPQFIFYFADAPEYTATDPREHTAHLLRSYRKSNRHTLTRLGRHCYRVTGTYPGSATAILRAWDSEHATR